MQAKNVNPVVGGLFGEASGMVSPRYDSSHDEGFVDHRYPEKKGNLGQEAGMQEKIRKTGSGFQVKSEHGKNLSSPNLSKKAAKKRLAQVEHFKNKEGKSKKGWTGRQRDMHVDIGQQIARESRSGRPAGPIRVDSDPDHPINLLSISSRPEVREGWNGGMSYSPPISRIKKATTLDSSQVNIKEF